MPDQKAAAAVPEQRSTEVASELREYFAKVDRERRDVSDEEAEEIITEAMRSVRPSYQPLSGSTL